MVYNLEELRKEWADLQNREFESLSGRQKV